MTFGQLATNARMPECQPRPKSKNIKQKLRKIHHKKSSENFYAEIVLHNGTAHFKKCKQLFEYQHLHLLRDIWW